MNIEVGNTVWWCDPDEEMCSGVYKVISHNNHQSYSLVNNKGSHVESEPHELYLCDSEGNPINIKKFDSTRRQHIQNLFAYILDVSWVHVTISYDFVPMQKIKS